MENLTGQATDAANQAKTAATNTVGNAQSAITSAVGNAQSQATAAVGDLQSKIPQVPKLPPIPQIPGVPEFKQKELPIPKKFKNNKFKDKLAAAADKAKQLAAKGQAAVAGAQAKVQSTIANAQEKAQKAISDAQEKVKEGIASVEEKATAMAEKAKQSVQDEIKKVQEKNGGKPLTEEEKDKILINKTTEVAENAAKPTQDAAKAALAKSNEIIGKPDLSEPQKFVQSHTTPEVGNKFYLYVERKSDGYYVMAAYKNENKSGYVNGTSFLAKTSQQGITALKDYLNNRYDG
jgi:hypothetical protein